jgi:hypothetical protein
MQEESKEGVKGGVRFQNLGVIDKTYVVHMPDGSVWEVPLLVLVLNRAEEYTKDHDSLLDAVLDTLECFSDDELIEDWAQNNMDWADVEKYAYRTRVPTEKPDYQEGWVNGEHEVK